MTRKQYPVRLLQLDNTDAEFKFKDKHGWQPRFAVEQIDGDRYYFVTQPDAELFIRRHGMAAVDNREFKKIRHDIIRQA